MGRIADMKDKGDCPKTYVLAVNEGINVLNGKWKMAIMASLLWGKKRYGELERDIPKISPRMLSKELRDLEANGIVARKVYNTIPVGVEYELTKSGVAFGDVLEVMLEWGLQHRKDAMGKA